MDAKCLLFLGFWIPFAAAWMVDHRFPWRKVVVTGGWTTLSASTSVQKCTPCTLNYEKCPVKFECKKPLCTGTAERILNWRGSQASAGGVNV